MSVKLAGVYLFFEKGSVIEYGRLAKMPQTSRSRAYFATVQHMDTPLAGYRKCKWYRVVCAKPFRSRLDQREILGAHRNAITRALA